MGPKFSIFQSLLPCFLAENQGVQNSQFFKAYSFAFWPKIKGSKILNFSKPIALLFGRKSRGPKFSIFQTYSLAFRLKIKGSIILNFSENQGVQNSQFFKAYSLAFLAKNQGVQNSQFFKAYSLAFRPKIKGSKILNFSKPIALLFG